MLDYKKISDSELINLLKESDHSAYNEIYHRYFYLTYVNAYKKLRDEEQAKDIVQDVFANLWFKRDFNLPQSNLAGYLFTAVRNNIFDLFAHEQVKQKHLESLQEFFSAKPVVSTDSRVREAQFQVYIDKQIEKLPPKMKLILEMSRKQQLSHKEIAQGLDTTENNVSKQLNNALRLLRTRLSSLLLFLF
ncbi:RNA polymerase sigma factor [Mucilaginibacter sp. UYCu711]|uniref:RNA polymerase sigma factor n=1 Tax=Mucilaginibacter sp. UYCu711 TaxID=3156339 RepID=UPI003D21467F